MSKIFKIGLLITALLLLSLAFINADAKYVAKKTKKAPKIKKGIDKIWEEVEMQPVNKNVSYVRDGKETAHEINAPKTDYSIDWGMCWDDKGIYLLIKIVDDKKVRELYAPDDPISDWSRDDCIGLLIPYDFKPSPSPLEFAWLLDNEIEAKARPRYGFPADQVQMAWTVEGNTHYAEIFLGWKGFQKVFRKKGRLRAGEVLPLEIRGRDDDGGGIKNYPQTFYQWSSNNKGIEVSGEGLGSVILSKETIDAKNFLGF